jgi:hypothetical protein
MRAAALETIRNRYSFENNIIETLRRTIPLTRPAIGSQESNGSFLRVL